MRKEINYEIIRKIKSLDCNLNYFKSTNNKRGIANCNRAKFHWIYISGLDFFYMELIDTIRYDCKNCSEALIKKGWEIIYEKERKI